MPALQEANPSANGRCSGACSSITSSASISTRKAITGPGRPVSKVATMPQKPPEKCDSHCGSAPWLSARCSCCASTSAEGRPIRASASITSLPSLSGYPSRCSSSATRVAVRNSNQPDSAYLCRSRRRVCRVGAISRTKSATACSIFSSSE